MAPGDKIIRRPFDVKYTKEELQPLVDEIRVQAKYDEIKVVMEMCIRDRFNKGIKVLSLFFIDEVDHYRVSVSYTHLANTT